MFDSSDQTEFREQSISRWEVFPPATLEDYVLVGELSLEGRLRPVRGVLPIALAAKQQGRKGLILPRQNELEAAVVEGLSLYPVQSLQEVVDLLNGGAAPAVRHVDALALFRESRHTDEDLQDVKGQEQAARCRSAIHLLQHRDEVAGADACTGRNLCHAADKCHYRQSAFHAGVYGHSHRQRVPDCQRAHRPR